MCEKQSAELQELVGKTIKKIFYSYDGKPLDYDDCFRGELTLITSDDEKFLLQASWDGYILNLSKL
jgi:hypothetical protein